MASPKVISSEVDLSTRVLGNPGVYVGIGLPNAKKGDVGKPVLCTSPTDFLNRFTPAGRIEVGYDLSYYSALSALEKTDRLWVVRPANAGAISGGLVLGSAVSTGDTNPVTSFTNTPLANPADRQFSASTTDQEVLYIYSADPGLWNNLLSIKISDNSAIEPNTFTIEVLYNSALVETWVCGRKSGEKDGYGRNLYVEDVLLSSKYIRALDNTAVATTVAVPYTATAEAITGGTEGTATTDSDLITAIKTLENTDAYPMRLVIDGGRTTAPYQKALISLAQGRKDCVAILSTPFATEASSDYITSIGNYRDNVLNANTSYAAMYSPHVKIYDNFNDREIFVSPDGLIAGIISETATNQEIWTPAAGFRRGVLNVLDVRRRFSTGEMDILYDKGINPIRFAPGRGIVVWGQKTLSSRPSSLNRLNVRLLLADIEPAISRTLDDFIMEQNDETSRTLIQIIITQYLENVRARRGIYDFSVKCDLQNNTPQDIDSKNLNVWVFVQPVQAIEFIKFVTVVNATGVTTQLAEQAL